MKSFLLRNVAYIIYFLMFLASFAAGNGILNENIYIKQFAFGIVFAAMLAIACFIPQKAGEIRITWGDVFVVALFAVYLFFFVGTNNHLDFAQPFVGFLFYVFIRMMEGSKPENTVQILHRIVPFVILLHLACCALQFFRIIPSFHDFFHVGGTFGNPDMLGAYLAVLSPFCYVGNGRKSFGIIVLCLTVILLLLIQARTAIVAIAVAGILYLLLSGKLSMRTFLIWILSPTIAGLALLVWWHPASVVGRLFVWWISLNMLVTRPTGWGLYAFEKHYPEFQADYIVSHDIPDIFNPDVVHSSFNEFLNIGVTLGVGGLFIFLLLVAYILFTAFKAKSPLLYSVCAFLVVSTTYFPLSIVPVSMMGIVLAALVTTQCPSKSLTSIRFDGITRWLLSSVMAVIVALTCYNYQFYHKWQTAFSNINGGYNSGFEKIYPALKGNGRFLITWSRERDLAGDSIKSLSLMKEAEQFFCDNVFLGNMALLCERNGQTEEAKMLFDRAMNMSLNQFNTAYDRILFLQRIGHHEEAYQAAVKLYQQPIRSKYYADPFIIKSRLKKLIQSYSKQEESCIE